MTMAGMQSPDQDDLPGSDTPDTKDRKSWQHERFSIATWYSNASNVDVNDPSGTFGEGATFDWTTFGLKIASTIAECVPHTRTGWYGTGAQLRAYHTWLLIPRNGNSTYVVMEETGLGPAARHLARTNPGHMHRGHELWNISLKFACES